MQCPKCGVEQDAQAFVPEQSVGAATIDAGADRLEAVALVLTVAGPLALLAAAAWLYVSAAG